MQDSSILRDLHGFNSKVSFCGGRRSSVLWPMGRLYGGNRDQASMDRCLITKGRVRIRPKGHGR